MPTLPHPVTGFGGVRFWILRDDADASLPDWSRPVSWAVHSVAGSGVTYRQRTHVGPRSITYRIEVESDDAEALMVLLTEAEPQTLTLVDGTATVEGEYEYVHGKGYRHVPDVLLVSLEPVTRPVSGGSQWLATFEVTT